MDKINHNFKKKYGQNFISDDTLINNIINSVDLNKNDLVIEIGPGAGALTKKLINKCNVLAYEIDKELDKYLNFDNSNFNIIWDDFLKRDIKKDIEKYKYEKLYIIANIPYYITTPIIEKITKEVLNLEKIIIMVQKEVGERFSAKPGCKDYGSLTIYLNYYYDIKKLFDVNRKYFMPVPNVDSVIISLNRKANKLEVKNEIMFFKLIKDSFRFKRKNLKNNLVGYDLNKIDSILKNNGYTLSNRAEELPIEVFVDISNNYNI